MKKILLLFVLLIAINGCKKDDRQVETASTPILTTNIITNITSTSATGGGNVTDDGGSPVTSRGVCYSTSQKPSIVDFTTNDGTGTGSFTSSLTGLQPYTTYYVRSYATNSDGTGFSSNEEQFTTYGSGTTNFPGQTVLVDGGTFLMGSPDGTGRDDEHPQHNVTLNSFRISKYEITNQQYADFMNAINANADGSVNGVSYLYDLNYPGVEIIYNGNSFVAKTGKENFPAVYVTWFGAKAYCDYYGGRLPTEAEWEFAARGGNSSNGYIYSGSNNIDEVAWYSGNGGKHPIGTKNANELGIYDMSGNVREWCNDPYDNNYYSRSPSNNPQGPYTPGGGSNRIARGGAFNSNSDGCRIAYRYYGFQPIYSSHHLGFRPVFAP